MSDEIERLKAENTTLRNIVKTAMDMQHETLRNMNRWAAERDAARAQAAALAEALRGLWVSYECQMKNEYDFPDDPWTPARDNDKEALAALAALAAYDAETKPE